MHDTVLYTTIYPGVEPYLPEWADSVSKQHDKNFDLVVGVDGVDTDILTRFLDKDVFPTWIFSKEGDTIAQIRQRSFEYVVSKYDIVIFVDSDDILMPTRVGSAKESILMNDVVACSLELIDKEGNDLGIHFHVDSEKSMETILPRFNILGLSNTTYRANTLKKCLPIPKECVLIDWFLAIKAWLSGAKIAFDPVCHMFYRQHNQNIACTVQPFSSEQILKSTKLVLDHYGLIFKYILPFQHEYLALFEKARTEINGFFIAVNEDRQLLEKYVSALNQLPQTHIWWSCVANPQLEEIWKN